MSKLKIGIIISTTRATRFGHRKITGYLNCAFLCCIYSHLNMLGNIS